MVGPAIPDTESAIRSEYNIRAYSHGRDTLRQKNWNGGWYYDA